MDYIKLDGSLVKNIETDANARLIARTIHNFCVSIGAKSIAEFVENGKIMELLGDMGIHYAQGYHVGKPEADLREEG